MASYSEWNNALCNFLFNEDKLGKPVYLHVPEEAFEDDSSLKALGGYSVFKSDMLNELAGCPDELIICAERKWAMDKRHLSAGSSLSVIPGHLALMLILSAATETDADGIESNAYYQRIPLFFGIKSPKSFVLKKDANSITHLYNRIQNWSEEICEGKLGIFRTQVLGHHAYVGIIQAQTIFKPSDIEELWLQFRKAGYRPGDQYSATDFENILTAGSFSQRIEKALSKPELKQVALLRAQEELESWDGELAASADGRMNADEHAVGQIILQIYSESTLDRRLVVGMRVRDPRDYFDDYTVLIPKRDYVNTVKRLVSSDSLNPGLTKVVIKPSEAISESIASFSKDFDVMSEDRSFIFRYRTKRVRLFVEPSTIGIFKTKGWIESSAIIKGARHLLMIENTFEEEFFKINRDRLEISSSDPVQVDESFKAFFSYFIVERITDTLVDSKNEILCSFAIADRPKIRPIWGLKADIRGNTYMRCSPPQIIQFSGIDEECKIIQDPENMYVIESNNECSSSVLQYRLNTVFSIQEKISFSVVKKGITLARCQLNFVDPQGHEDKKYFVNSIGEILNERQEIDRYLPQDMLISGSRKCPEIKFVGRRPGELCDQLNFDRGFDQCWAVEVRGAQKTFHFIGSENLTILSSLVSNFPDNTVVASNNKDKIINWINFIFNGDIRCGISAKSYQNTTNFSTHSVFVKNYLQRQRDWILKKFPNLK